MTGFGTTFTLNAYLVKTANFLGKNRGKFAPVLEANVYVTVSHIKRAATSTKFSWFLTSQTSKNIKKRIKDKGI